MDDLISRQAAIDAVRKAYENDWMFDEYEYYLNELPSVQTERKKGKWIKRENHALGYNCTACGKSEVSNNFNFCPNCGADMRGE